MRAIWRDILTSNKDIVLLVGMERDVDEFVVSIDQVFTGERPSEMGYNVRTLIKNVSRIPEVRRE